MKKRFTKAFAMLLVLAMVLSILPVSVLAADVAVDTGAELISTAPEDMSYGVIFNPNTDGKTGYVMGYDISGGNAASKPVELTDDGNGIKKLPNGTAIVKFIKNADGTYYFTLGGKYLAIQDVGSDKEQMILLETPGSGAKWTIMADKANMAGAFNIKNAEYKYNGNSDVYLEQYNGQKFCGWSYKDSTPQYFQMKFALTGADDDGRVGEIKEAGALPEDGAKVVIYSDEAKAVFGQPTGADVAAPALLPAAAVLSADGTLAYENIADGGLIFTVSEVDDGVYTFENNGRYLAMPENTVEENGAVGNDETLLMIEWPEDADKQEVPMPSSALLTSVATSRLPQPSKPSSMILPKPLSKHLSMLCNLSSNRLVASTRSDQWAWVHQTATTITVPLRLLPTSSGHTTA